MDKNLVLDIFDTTKKQLIDYAIFFCVCLITFSFVTNFIERILFVFGLYFGYKLIYSFVDRIKEK